MGCHKTLTRRQFLAKSGATATAVVSFPYIVPSCVFGAEAPSNRITMGCIGVGSQGTSNLWGFLEKRQALVLAVCDVDSHRLNRAKDFIDREYQNSDCATYRDFRELIARVDIDALSIAVPDHWHSIPVVAAARAGKDMYAEKPLARTIHEGRVMVDAVQRYGCIWQTGSWQRSVRDFRYACELVLNGRIGKVHTVEVGLPTGVGGPNPPVESVPEDLDWDFWLGPAPWRAYQKFGRNGPHWDWRWIMDYSGGQLTDWIGHHLDTAHWGLGLDRTGPIEIEGTGVYPRDGIYDVPTAYRIVCRYATGVTIVIANDRKQPKGMGVVWYGEKGWIHVDRGRFDAEPKSILGEVIGPNEIRLYESRDHIQNFLDCVKSRRETVAPIDIAHRSISVGLLGEIAMLMGRKLKWDPEKEQFINDGEASRMLSRPMRSPWVL
jgi:predicted dehydrogenase